MTQDKRLTGRLTRYWQLICRDNKFPSIQRFNKEAVHDLWPQCVMVSVNTRGGITYTYEYVGEAFIEAYGEDLTGRTLDHKGGHFPNSVMLESLDKVVSEHKVLEDEGHLLNKEGRLIKYRACFLPFGNKKKGLTHIVVGLSFRVFS